MKSKVVASSDMAMFPWTVAVQRIKAVGDYVLPETIEVQSFDSINEHDDYIKTVLAKHGNDPSACIIGNDDTVYKKAKL